MYVHVHVIHVYHDITQECFERFTRALSSYDKFCILDCMHMHMRTMYLHMYVIMCCMSGMKLTCWETGLLSWLKGNFAVLDHLSSSRAGVHACALHYRVQEQNKERKIKP